MDLRQFLELVVTTREGWFNLSFAPPRGPGFWESWYEWPNQMEEALEEALTRAEDCNVYYSSYLFSEPDSHKVNVLPSRTIQADLDGADVLTLPLQPSVLVETSAGRHQGYWFLKEALTPESHEFLSRKLTYAVKDADTSGWPLGRKVRVPYTFNYKYLEGAQEIKVISAGLKVYREEELELLEEPPPFLLTVEQVEFLDLLSEKEARVGNLRGPQELFASVKAKLPPLVQTQYNSQQLDRSKALWALMCSLFRAGLTKEEVWHLAWNSANNKFQDLKYHAERELAKDVLRAEATVKAKVVDERGEISAARVLPGPVHERRAHIFDLVLGYMRSAGEFIHASDDSTWYIRNDVGRPIRISAHSDWLDTTLDIQFGLNNTEADKSYVTHALVNFCRSLPETGSRQSLSYYDPDARHLLLHTGRKDVLRITPSGVDRTTDGSFGVVFPWSNTRDLFLPKLGEPDEQWAEHLFDGAFDNLIGVESDDALTLLRVWVLFLLFRSTAVSRPILAAFGQPGAGKSTLFRRIYRLLYGKEKSVLKLTSPDNFDFALATDPFIVADNVDTPERWLPDRLALAASTAEIAKRKLYTDADEYTLRCQALVGITAHNPRFTREDVSDRLILLVFKRLEEFFPEGEILDKISDRRNYLWGGIVQDCQKVISTQFPSQQEIPQFRVEDYARTGFWIAKALGIGPEFTRALEAVGHETRSLNLNEDQILVDALRAYISHGKGLHFATAGQIWSDLQTVAPDAHQLMKLYRGAIYLGKKLLTLQDSLGEIFEVEVEFNKISSSRRWKFRLRDADS